MNEAELRVLVEQSEKVGFRALFQEYQTYVYSIVWGHIRGVGTAEDAEECLSDVFAEVFLKFADIRIGSLKAYIGSVAKRTALHKYRCLCSHNDAAEEMPRDIPDATDIQHDFEKNEYYRLLYEKVDSLGEPDSTIIIQKFFYERSSADIGRYVGLSPTAVRVRLNRALKRLRKLLTNANER